MTELSEESGAQTPTGPRVALVGRFVTGALEKSYATAFESIGCDVLRFDQPAAERRYIRGGRAGEVFNLLVPVEVWQRQAGRDLVLEARRQEPDVILVFGQNRIGLGTLGQLRASTHAKLVLVWVDTLVNFPHILAGSVPQYDLVATYSEASVPFFERLGARAVTWLPLASDPTIHGRGTSPREADTDVSFVGLWRPEREAALSAILDAFPLARLRVWGPDWDRRARDPRVRAAWDRTPIFESAFRDVVARSRVCLNVIDETNYPAANMRFFEIPCAGGAEVCSLCPEMAGDFRDGEEIAYFNSSDGLVRQVAALIDDEPRRQAIADRAHALIVGGHTYAHRCRTLLDQLS